MKQSQLELNNRPTLSDYQKYIQVMVKERGFHKETILQIVLLMVEEFGELAKAIRKNENMKIDNDSREHNLEHEIADIFIYLLDLCNHLGVDLEKAFRDKEKINKKRFWK